MSELLTLLREPETLWTRGQVLARPSAAPAVSGVYGWHFVEPPCPELEGGRLLYVGIAPRRMSTRTSTQTLRARLRAHFRGNAAVSTLRLSLGCLLGLPLRRVGSGSRMTFGPDGEQELSDWMEAYARVCWHPSPQPWVIESAVIAGADLPLNLDQNRLHPFHPRLSQVRAQAKATARSLPIL